MRVRSNLMVAFVVFTLACSQQSQPLQEQSAFASSISDNSTSPYFVKVQVLDSSTKRKFTTCVTANLFRGALHIEHGFPYTDAGSEALEKFALSNQDRVFSFQSPSALQNIPWHPSASELSDAQSLIAAMSDEALKDSLNRAVLRNYYAKSSRHRERMGALACALIDRGLVPRLADMTGSLYVEE